MVWSFKKQHRLLLQGVILLAMLLLPFFLYLSAEAGIKWLVITLLGGLVFVMLFAVWVSGDRKES
jgi:hypothetical protein